jgi:hypothetical protein
MKTRGCLVFLLLTVAGFAAEPNIEFSGVLGVGGDTRVALVNKASGSMQWVQVGKDFAGYRVTAYEPKTEDLLLAKDGQRYRLHLKDAKVKSGTAGEPPPEIKRAILNNLRQLAAAADQFYLENGKNRATYDDLVGETKYVRKMEAAAGEDYRTIEFAQGKPLVVTLSSGYTMSYDN